MSSPAPDSPSKSGNSATQTAHQAPLPRLAVLLSEGFRLFFSAAGFFAILAILTWLMWLWVERYGSGEAMLPVRMAPYQWHAHEMIFGYLSAVVAGFFLTAVPNWTGTLALDQKRVILLGSVWLLGRLAMWSSGALPAGLVAVLDLAFIPLIMLQTYLAMRHNFGPRNGIFLIILLAYWLSAAAGHAEWLDWLEDGADHGAKAGLMMTAVMVVIIGGRIVPAFTRNALKRAGVSEGLPVQHEKLDMAGNFAALFWALAMLFGAPEIVLGIGAFLVTGLNLVRFWQWGRWKNADPLVWNLRVSYGALLLGFFALGLAWTTEWVSEVNALHWLAIAAITGMTLAVMSRATLGHSGRPLIAPKGASIIYLAVLASGAARFFAIELGMDDDLAIAISGFAWLVAFFVYLVLFLPYLMRPRQ